MTTRPNVWRFEPETIVLGLYTDDGKFLYEVNLEDCIDSARTRDWVAQVAKKTWATDRIVADLVRALNDMLELQGSICGGGVGKNIDVKKAIKGREVRPVRQAESVGGLMR